MCRVLKWSSLVLLAIFGFVGCFTIPPQFTTFDDFDPALLGNSNAEVIIPFGAGFVDQQLLLGNVWIVNQDNTLEPSPLLDASLLVNGALTTPNSPNTKAFGTTFLKAYGSLSAKLFKQFDFVVSSENDVQLTGTVVYQVGLASPDEWDNSKVNNAASFLSLALQAPQRAIVIKSYD